MLMIQMNQINICENSSLKPFNDTKIFIEYQNDMGDIHKNIEGYKPNKKRKILVVFDDMVADMLSNKKLKKAKHSSCFY